MKDTIERNLLEVKKKIEPYTVNIIAVTKYFDYTAIIDAYDAGVRDFGENRVLEAVAKMKKLSEDVRKNSRFHLIGHLQKNKVKKAVGKFDLVHSVDSLELARIIDDEAKKQGIVQDVLIQINNAKEPQKSGFYPEELLRIFGEIVKLKNIRVRGLMNMAPLIDDRDRLKELFNGVAKLKVELENKYSIKDLDNCNIKEYLNFNNVSIL